MRLLQALQRNIWAMEPILLDRMSHIILRHSEGIRLTQDEIDGIVASRGDAGEDTDVRMVGNIAVVPITGVISKGARGVNNISQPRGTSTGEIQRDFGFALDDAFTQAIILDIDSPGGTVAGIESTSNFIFKNRGTKPIIAFVQDLGASAAWWLASQADLIVVMEGASLGSIGVFSVAVDTSEAAKREGVQVTVIGSGSLKGMGQPGTKITNEHKAELAKSVNDTNEIFIRHVARGRGISVEQVKAVAGGGTFRGMEALANLMVDKVGSFDDAIDLAQKRISNPSASASVTIEDSQSSMIDITNTAVELAEAILAKGDTMAAKATKAGVGPTTAMVGSDDQSENLAIEQRATDKQPVAKTRTLEVPMERCTRDDESALREQGIKAERERAAEINALASAHDLSQEWLDKQIDGGSTIQDARESALKQLRDAKVPVAVRIGHSAIESLAGDIEDAICIRAGHDIEKPSKGHRNFVSMPLAEMCRRFLEHHGVATNFMSRPQLCKEVFRLGLHGPSAAFNEMHGATGYGNTTSDFPLILENAVNKRLLSVFKEAIQTWSRIFSKVTVPDFKQIKAYRAGEVGELPLVKENEPYTETTTAEAREVYAIKKYGRLYTVSWETMVNDDLSAFDRIPTNLALAAARTINKHAFQPIISAVGGEVMSDGTALFHANHKNLVASGGAPTVATLGFIRKQLRLQTGLNAEVVLGLDPKFLLVPPSLETLAEQLISSSVDPTKSNQTPNPFANKLEIIVESLLEAHSATAWYVLADPRIVPTVEVAFLEGEEAPRLEQEDGFKVDGRTYKVKLQVGTKAIDWRGMQKNPGV